MPASLKAISKLVNFSRCLPVPLVKKISFVVDAVIADSLNRLILTHQLAVNKEKFWSYASPAEGTRIDSVLFFCKYVSVI